MKNTTLHHSIISISFTLVDKIGPFTLLSLKKPPHSSRPVIPTSLTHHSSRPQGLEAPLTKHFPSLIRLLRANSNTNSTYAVFSGSGHLALIPISSSHPQDQNSGTFKRCRRLPGAPLTATCRVVLPGLQGNFVVRILMTRLYLFIYLFYSRLF